MAERKLFPATTGPHRSRACLRGCPNRPKWDTSFSAIAYNDVMSRSNSLERGGQTHNSNALTHGLTSDKIFQAETATYEEYVRRFTEQYEPATAMEEVLIARLARIAVRLQRAGTIDFQAFAQCFRPSESGGIRSHTRSGVCWPRTVWAWTRSACGWGTRPTSAGGTMPSSCLGTGGMRTLTGCDTTRQESFSVLACFLGGRLPIGACSAIMIVYSSFCDAEEEYVSV